MRTTDSNHSLTRRALLKAGGAAAIALSVPGSALAKRRRRHKHKKRLQSHLRRSSYHRLVGQRFTVGGTSVKLQLVKVEDLNVHQRNNDNAFALIFEAPPGAPLLTDQVPDLYNPALGRFKFLLSRGFASPHGQPYVAIVNRLHA
jgi:uncharacterized protein DUF6916